jgi:hypothetical protein
LPEACEAVYLQWLKPVKKERLEKYSIRMSHQIQSDEPFFVPEISLCGMIAAEITRIFPRQSQSWLPAYPIQDSSLLIIAGYKKQGCKN